MDISQLSAEDLAKLQQDLPAELARRKQEAKKIVLGKIQQVLDENGLTFADVEEHFSGQVKRRGRPKNTNAPQREKVIRFRHPENPELTWTGAGRRPNWVIEWEQAHGGDNSALRVDAAA